MYLTLFENQIFFVVGLFQKMNGETIVPILFLKNNAQYTVYFKIIYVFQNQLCYFELPIGFVNLPSKTPYSV